MQPEDVQDQDIEQMLREIATLEHQQITAEIQKAHQRGPSPGPNLERMYTAILRENFTKEELKAIKEVAGLKEKYDTVKEQVWYPTIEELTDYINEPLTLDDDLRQQIEYHLEVDQCRSSLRLSAWLKVKHAAMGKVRSVQKGVEDVFTKARELGAVVSHAYDGLNLAPAMGAAKKLKSYKQIEFDRCPTTELVMYDNLEPGTYSCSSASCNKGTVVEIGILSDPDQGAEDSGSNMKWRRYLVLSASRPDGKITGKCERCNSEKDLDPDTRAHHTIICGPVNVNELNKDDADDLRKSWDWTKNNAPQAKAHWKAFAEKLSEADDEDLRTLGDQIQNESDA